MKQGRFYQNRLGIAGWLKAGNYSIARYLYTLQRLSGVGLIIFLLLHIIETKSRIQGGAAWEATMGALETPLFIFFEWVVMIGFIFHAVNGIRLVLIEFGVGLGKPGRPIFPYEHSIRRQRPLMWGLMMVVVLLGVISIFDFFVW